MDFSDKIFFQVLASEAGSGPQALVAFDGEETYISVGEKTFNIASVTRNDFGDYTVHFTHPITNPIPNITILEASPSDSHHASLSEVSSSHIRILTKRNGENNDVAGVYLVVF
jgi:hypothetical protein